MTTVSEPTAHPGGIPNLDPTGCTILRADARRLPLPDESVDLIVTSPPYFSLRSYVDGGQHYAGQIGSEPTPQEYIAALIACTREWARVLKPTGSIFVNLGDKYAERSGPPRGGYVDDDEVVNRPADRPARGRRGSIPVKSLMLLPERYRIAAVDELGLIARAVVVWDKPNPMPESVKDRVRRSHEDWVHLTKRQRYFAAVDAIREPSSPQKGAAGSFKRDRPSHTLVPGQAATQHRPDRPDVPAYHALGKLPGSVWKVATEPLRVPEELEVDHYAAFPTYWPRQLITGWSPSGICTACGEPRRPLTDQQRLLDGEPIEPGSGAIFGPDMKRKTRNTGIGNWRFASATAITGEACGCPDTSAPTRPAVVLDPFGGTGTTALVASVLGRHGITVDRSADYCRIARWRTHDPKQRARAGRAGKRHRAQQPTSTELPGQIKLL